jgi:hypothetical protein
MARPSKTSVSMGFPAMLQRHAVQKFPNDEGLTVLLPDFVDSADIGMVQGRSSLSLSLETG